MNRRLDLSALIEANRAVTAPSAEDRERNRGKIAARVGSGIVVIGTALSATRRAAGGLSGEAASGATATAGMSGALAGGLAKWLAVSALVAIGGGVGVHFAKRHLVAVSSSSVVASHPSAPPAAPAPEVAHTELATVLAPPIDSVRPSVPSGRVAKPNTFAGPAGSDKSFRRAVELLRSARRALDSNSPGAALTLLDRYADEFPRGSALQPEYEATRVLALCAVGRAEAGARARDHFLERQSASPLAERVRKACGSP
jgi:RNA polymerase sigma-70 factor (ECF subfamily)